jgi:hypothetical protein
MGRSKEHPDSISTACRCQAETMAANAGIKLTEQQIASYVEHRRTLPGPDTSSQDGGFKPWLLSDQELLHRILSDNQADRLESTYPNIFRSDS